ncbi:MAG: Fe-S cluster assembly protein SufD [Marivirga sp.]|nr:Fe-S cluster assembly protein SufD [Marivirga sp.]
MSVAVNEKITTDGVVSLIDKSLSLNPSVLALRKEALTSFQKLGLPEKKSEEYKHTPVTRLLQQHFNLEDVTKVNSDLDPKEFFIPSIEGNIVVLINGIFSQKHSKIISPASEVRITNLADALKDGDPIAKSHVGKYADHSSDAFIAWNTASWVHGVFIDVPENTVVEKPVIVYHIHDARDGQAVSSVRNLVFIGKSSTVTLIEKFDSSGAANHFSNTVTEAVVDENASLDLYSIQNDAGSRYQYGLTQIHQYNTSRVNTFTFTLNGKLVRNNLHLSLDGEGIESHMFGLYLITGDTLADNHTVVDHKKPNSFSNEIYKGIMDDNSKGVFNGKIYVRPQAQKTNAFQANRNILLSDKAVVNTKPQLEIWADDVKCSHGCTTGQLDEEAMFYLQTRGIHKETARAMMLYAFAIEILNNVKHPELKAYFDHLVSERLHKNF